MRTHRQYIAEAIKVNGDYSHNIIGMSLAAIERDEGKEAVLRVFKKYPQLVRRYGFIPPKED